MPVYGSDLTYGKTITASSTYDPGGDPYNASNAIDDTGALWQCAENQTANSWLKVDFGVGEAEQIEKFTLDCHASYPVKNFKIQGSNNDSDWDDLDTDLHPNDGDTATYTFSNSTAYRYCRLLIIDTYVAQWVLVIEIEMMKVNFAISVHDCTDLKEKIGG